MAKKWMVVFLIALPLMSFSQQRPNIIYIMSDDHDADAISAYNTSLISTPNIDRIAKEGMLFTHCFVGNSICAPARATILTGQHSHLNGVKDNRTTFDGSKMTMPKILQQNGYQTAMIGKWHLRSYPTGFGYWTIFPGQGSYYRPSLIEMNGDTVRYPDKYATDLITYEAINWLQNQRDGTKPFLLMLHHKAPHRYWFPSLKYIKLFTKKKFPEPPTLYMTYEGKGTAWQKQTMMILKTMTLCTDLKIDPAYLEDIPELKPDSNEIRGYDFIMNLIPEGEREIIRSIYAERGKILQKQRPAGDALLKLKYQWYMQDYLACIASVDENVGRLLDYLDKSSLAQNTVVMYTSDQGFYLGENGWFDKRWMYDVSMQTPLLVRWPGKIKKGSANNSLVQNIDIAPTILDIAGVKPPDWMQGLSIQPILTGKQNQPDRKYLYYHYYEYPEPYHSVLPHLGIRGERYKLIYFYTVEEWELYDMEKDPAEQHNLINDPHYQSIVKDLQEELKRQRLKYEDTEPAGVLK